MTVMNKPNSIDNKLDVQTVLSLLEEAVADKGSDYIYNEQFDLCQYYSERNGGGCACIIGHILDKVEGVDVPTLVNGPITEVCGVGQAGRSLHPQLNRLGVDLSEFVETAYSELEIMEDEPLVWASEDAIRVMWTAQLVQDSPSNFTWGDALTVARAVATKLRIKKDGI